MTHNPDSSGGDELNKVLLPFLKSVVTRPDGNYVEPQYSRLKAAINRYAAKAVLAELKETARIWSSFAMKDHLRERIAELQADMEGEGK